MSEKTILIRTTSENHNRYTDAAKEEGKSLNSFIVDALKTYCDSIETWKDDTEAALLNARANYTNSLNESLYRSPKAVSIANSFSDTALSQWSRSVNHSYYSEATDKLAGKDSNDN
jgi:hypothetical protein